MDAKQTIIRRSCKRAFTLVELLVVVTILALLMAILLPSLARARRQATSVACKSNARQVDIGMTMYLHEYGMYPAHQWIITEPPEVRFRWFNAMVRMLGGYKVQNCPAVADWEVGRNNSYGYNYKYLGSARDNTCGAKAPYESFPVKSLRMPGRTIAFGDSDGTGWKKPHVNGVNDPDMFGNHGYALDPIFIPEFSLQSYSGGENEPYAWKRYRTYISTRHLGGSNLCFADGHVEPMMPRRVYVDNRFWNGLGGEDLSRDRHVSYRHLDGEWRFAGISLDRTTVWPAGLRY